MDQLNDRLLLSSIHKREDSEITNHIKVKKFPDGNVIIYVYTNESKKGIVLSGDNLKKFKNFIERC